DQHLAARQVEVHLPDQLDDLADGVLEADVDEQPFAAAVDQEDVDAEPPPGLVVHLDDVGEQVFPLAHGRALEPRRSGGYPKPVGGRFNRSGGGGWRRRGRTTNESKPDAASSGASGRKPAAPTF